MSTSHATLGREPAGHAVVHGADVLGGRWLDGYEVTALRAEGTTHRVRLDPERLHPRLVLPFGLLLWGTGLPDLRAALVRAARQPVRQTVEALRQPVTLPATCPARGRCPVTARDGRLVSVAGRDEEGVAAALLHRGRCPASEQVTGPDWAACWDHFHRRGGGPSLVLLALSTTALLQTTDDDRLADVLDRLAGTGHDEDELCVRYQGLSHRAANRGFLRWKKVNHYGSRGTCARCGGDVYPDGGSCSTCGRYPGGPDRRSTVLDRLERELQVVAP